MEDFDKKSDAHPQAGVALTDREREIQRRLDEMIHEYLDYVAVNETVGEVIKSIAREAFEIGVDRDALIGRLLHRDIFSAEGKVGEVLSESIREVITQVYDTAVAIAFSRAPFARKKRARQALVDFLMHEFTPDRLSVNFFRDLVEGRIESVGPVIDPEHPENSVRPEEIIDWAIDTPVIELIVNRMSMFVEPLIRDTYRTFIRLNPEKYIANSLGYILRVTPRGADFKISRMNELFHDVCLSINFETFWKMVQGYMDATELDFREKHPNEDFDKKWFEIWKEAFAAMWKTASFHEEARVREDRILLRPLGDQTVGAVRKEVERRVFFALLPPGRPFDGNGISSGSHEKWRIVVQEPDGRPIANFYCQDEIRGTNENYVRGYVRHMLFSNSTVAGVLQRKGIHLQSDGPEVNDLVSQLRRAKRGCSIEPVRTRRNRRSGYRVR